ncbi:MAG: pyridoxal 5'-phosphate synthase glutaminase subunit PdxT [Desulfovibrionaceae bacterium]|nr:pyridoxal 5'-phosphate synthase glutaminase subunit PdxT [Desulfovibrionaceae bacterium]
MARCIGVLALQGDFREHALSLERCGASVREIRTLQDLDGVDGLVLPGGESTVMGRLLTEEGLMEPVRALCRSGMPVLGTCAGMILLAKTLPEFPDQPRIGCLDISVVRNAFGRQTDSFSTELAVSGFGGDEKGQRTVQAVFIRAPIVQDTGEGVEVLSCFEGRPVAVRQKNILALAFHPELTPELCFHRWLLEQ